MKLKNKKIVHRLIYESLILEQDEQDKQEKQTKKPKKKATGIKLDKYKDSVLDQATTNRLAIGRPKAIGRDLKEKSTDPKGAAEIFETLGISGVGGSNVYETVASLMQSAASHPDMGMVIGDAVVVVNSSKNPTKAGTAISMAGGLPPKESFYYVRELWRAAKTMGVVSGGEGNPRLESTTDGEFLLFYHGPSSSWFKEE